jgi:hypothetical protein
LNFNSLSAYVETHGYHDDQSRFEDEGWSLANPKTLDLLDKLDKDSVPLEIYVDGRIFRGILTGLNKAFIIDEKTRQELILADQKSQELIKPFALGRDIKRYQPINTQNYLIFMPKGWTNTKTTKNAWNWFSSEFPAVANYLIPFEQKAKKRWDQGEYWWELRACSYYDEFEKPKIMFPDISLQGNFTLDEKGGLFTVNTSYIIPVEDLFLLGLLNSRLFTFAYSKISSSYRGGYLRYIYQYVAKLPIKKIDLEDPSENHLQGSVVRLVEHMLELHKRSPKTPYEQERLEREIDATDTQIDHLVYELYGLTEEEIEIVEEETRV